MPITFACPGCSKTLRARDGEAGKSVRCPKCQTPLRVPFFPVSEASEPVAPVIAEPMSVRYVVEQSQPPTVEIEHRLSDLTAGRTFRAGFGAELGKEAARAMIGCLVFLFVIAAVIAVIMLRVR